MGLFVIPDTLKNVYLLFNIVVALWFSWIRFGGFITENRVENRTRGRQYASFYINSLTHIGRIPLYWTLLHTCLKKAEIFVMQIQLIEVEWRIYASVI